MRREDVSVLTAAAGSEAGRDPGQPRLAAGLGCGAREEAGGDSLQEPGKQWKKFLYCEPHKRIKEVLEEELYIKRDECHIKNSPAGFYCNALGYQQPPEDIKKHKTGLLFSENLTFPEDF